MISWNALWGMIKVFWLDSHHFISLLIKHPFHYIILNWICLFQTVVKLWTEEEYTELTEWISVVFPKIRNTSCVSFVVVNKCLEYNCFQISTQTVSAPTPLCLLFVFQWPRPFLAALPPRQHPEHTELGSAVSQPWSPQPILTTSTPHPFCHILFGLHYSLLYTIRH